MLNTVPDTVELDLYFAQNDRGEEAMPSAKLMRMARLAASDAVEPKLRHKIAVELAQAYFDADDVQALDEYLAELPMENIRQWNEETAIALPDTAGEL